MKVYLISLATPFQQTAPAKRCICYLKALQEAGVECQWLLKKQADSDGHPTTGQFEGIPYKMVGGTCKISPKWKRLVFCLFSEVLTLLYMLAKLKRGDVVYLYSQDIYWCRWTCRVAHLKGAKTVTELCEFPFYAQGEETSETLQNRDKYQKQILPAIDGIIPISDALAEYATKYVRKDCKIIKVPILVDFEQYDMEDKSSEAEIPYIFHSGTLYEQKDGILGMIEAFGKACKQLDKPIRFISTGTKEKSPHATEIDALIQKYDLKDKVNFTGYLSDEDLKDHLQKASMVIINKAPNQQNSYCFSTKLGEYMAAGKAIIITRVGEAMNWLTDGKDALVIPPSENDTLVDAIVRLFSDDELRKTLGENARETCRKSFDYRSWGNVMKQKFQNL